MPDLSADVRIFILSLIYAVVGIALLIAGYRVFDMLTPTDAQKKIFEEGNMSVGIVVGSFVIGLALVIAAAIGG